jgi:hypothetical protein
LTENTKYATINPSKIDGNPEVLYFHQFQEGYTNLKV